MIYSIPEDHIFPLASHAEPDGLLAVGGDLHPSRVLLAYKSGIFPWYSDYEPILWWSPNPRFVLYPGDLKIAKSMRPILRKRNYTVTIDKDFEAVIGNCKVIPRGEQAGTWITDEMKQSYINLHKMGAAHSAELWNEEGELCGGLYGISFGKLFCGESMFAKQSNASKIVFIYVVQFLKANGFEMIDCQTETAHLGSLGAKSIERGTFLECVKRNRVLPDAIKNWSADFNRFFLDDGIDFF